MIPELLYRGDSDKKGDRQLRIHLRNGLLCTNLISGGNGAIIFKTPLIELVKHHINPGWEKTHFLSFSELEEKAYSFGCYGFNGEMYPFLEDSNNWDFTRLTFKTTKFTSINLREPGVYECKYKPSLREFENEFVLLLINTVEYLRANISLNTDSQIKNAERDREWLVLPSNLVLLNNRFVEYSAKVDMSDVIDYELYIMR